MGRFFFIKIIYKEENTMRKRFIYFVLIFILSACGTSPNNESIAPSESPPVTGSDGMDEEEDKGFDEKIDLKKGKLSSEELDSYAEFKGSTFLFSVSNQSNNDVDIVFSSSQEFDYIVLDENGAKVKQLSDGMMYTQAMKEIVLGPGDILKYEVSAEEVTNDLPSGSYTITFIFTGDQRTEATTDFNVAID